MRKEDRAITVELDGYSWNIIFTDREGFENADLPSSCDGITKFGEFSIYIDKNINPTAQKEVIIHELTHAILCTQGRWYQKKFDVEELCEFVGFCGEKIINATNKIMSEWLKGD